MNARRPPSAPPEIPGFSYVQLLGSGGFADVFLYEQRMPRRRVAIKVLLSEALTEGARESFDAEANLMAQLSTHPSIVTIYQADIAGDGRPYLAMEYCPKPNLGARYRREKISVAEALRIGIQVAGAVETSHRAGILHRDIKPANILVTEYNRPALTDFGISVALVGGGGEQESVGMSIPWSPPEVFGSDPSSGTGADIYSLGATVYTILAGRSPFEVAGGSNSGLDLIARIQGSTLQPTGRADVPPSLEEVLATSMAKDERSRYSSALEFARALQKVQLELSLSVTPADVLDDQLPTDDLEEEDDGNTRIRGIVTIDPTGPAPSRTAPGRTTPGRGAPSRSGQVPTFSSPAGAPPAASALPDVTERTQRRGSAPAPALPGAAPTGTGISAPPGSTGTPARPRGTGSGAPGTRTFYVDDPPVEQTVQRPPTGPDSGDPTGASPSRRRPLPYILGGAALVLVIGVGAIVFALNGGAGSPAQQDATETDKPVDQIQITNSTVPGPTAVTGAVGVDGNAVFTWDDPAPESGDTYRWAVVTPGQTNQAVRIDQPTVTVPTGGAASVCIEVSVVRSDGKGSEPTIGCTP
ncbi:serine/threonine-protein kinase [Herbiconiux solani]|uniref:serine/threonine-protein kinase n=1 Tax=Herbiconiux solani TaxID=661329 RepID=UPI0008242F6B|nr:serine/threonine-protein kinase [Herbiconiux solani]